MPKTDAELRNEKREKLFFGWMIGLVFTISLAVLYTFGYPLYQALGYSLLILLGTPLVLVGLLLICITPYEALFFAFILMLEGQIRALKWLGRRGFCPKQARFARKYVHLFKSILVLLKGEYITEVVLWGIYNGIKHLLKPDHEPATSTTNG